MFDSNSVDHGGGIYCEDNGHISVEGNSTVLFNNNSARLGGALYSNNGINISFVGNSTAMFNNNTADSKGGAMRFYNGHVSFVGNSATVFTDNTACLGGAVNIIFSSISFEGNSNTMFYGNTAILMHQALSFEEKSSTVFSDNVAVYFGGAILTLNLVDFIFDDNSFVTFNNNEAKSGATVLFQNDNFQMTNILAIANFTLKFNDLAVKWCNSTCLPYDKIKVIDTCNNITIIDSTDRVWCSNPKIFVCQSIKCYCNNLTDVLVGMKNNSVVNISDKVILSSPIQLSFLQNFSIV